MAIDGDLGLRIDELRIGSVVDDARYISVTANFEHLSSVCSYRPEDGAARSPSQALVFPEADGASEMSAVLPDGADTITLVAPGPVPLEEFETQLAVFQGLLSFAADIPCGRLAFVATEPSGQTVQILGRDKYAPFERKARLPIEYSLRFSGEWLQQVIDRWWAAHSNWRPVPQIVAGLRYQPGYVEADVILSSAAIEALATEMLQHPEPSLSDEAAQPIRDALQTLQEMSPAQKETISRLKNELSRTTFRSKVRQLVTGVDSETWRQSRVSMEDWIGLFIKARNGIAHAAPGLNGQANIWNEGDLLRSIRDANWTVITLVILCHLGVPAAAISSAAERLGTRYGTRHRSSRVFT